MKVNIAPIHPGEPPALRLLLLPEGEKDQRTLRRLIESKAVTGCGMHSETGAVLHVTVAVQQRAEAGA